MSAGRDINLLRGIRLYLVKDIYPALKRESFPILGDRGGAEIDERVVRVYVSRMWTGATHEANARTRERTRIARDRPNLAWADGEEGPGGGGQRPLNRAKETTG